MTKPTPIADELNVELAPDGLIEQVRRLEVERAEAIELIRQTNPTHSHQHAGMGCWFCAAGEFLARVDSETGVTR